MVIVKRTNSPPCMQVNGVATYLVARKHIVIAKHCNLPRCKQVNDNCQVHQFIWLQTSKKMAIAKLANLPCCKRVNGIR